MVAAEVYAFMDCCDFAYTLKEDLKNILGRELKIALFTDSKSLFDTITSLSTVTEKRLLIDISAQRDSYNTGELYNIGLVLSESNLADPLTKRTKSPLLQKLMTTGKLDHPVNQWIVHSNKPQVS